MRSCPFFLLCFYGFAEAAPTSLPRFTEEREVAALHFTKKQLPELLPILDELKKNLRPQYEQKIREIFQVTESLADLLDEPKRYELELKFWRTENRALLIVAQLSVVRDSERSRLESNLRELARELVDLQIQSLELQVESLEKDLQDTREELTRTRDNLDKLTLDRYQTLLEKVKKKK